MSESISPAKVEANQRNAQRATGPKDTTSTRYNAAKHGLLAQGITELDDGEAYKALLQSLNETYKPAGDMETFLVERIALAMVRLRRIARLEAEYITAVLNPPIRPERPRGTFEQEVVVVDSGLPARVGVQSVAILGVTFQRYESSIENKLYRAMNQLERLQRMRQGEHVSAPASVDVTVHSTGHSAGHSAGHADDQTAGAVGSFGN